MIDCAAARAAIIEADPRELDGLGDSELAVHVAACARCRAAARIILDAHLELQLALARATPRRSSAEAVETSTRRMWRRRWVWRAAPLATAAVLAITLLGHRAPVPRTTPGPSAAGSAVAVEAPPGRSVAVFHTDNPDIVVIWFF